MVALHQSDPNCRSARHSKAHRNAGYALTLVLAAAFGLTVLVFYPGYVTIDARYVYAEARAWHFGDWQSPAMGALWRIIDPLAPGSLSMFLLTISLYWLGFGMLAFIALRRSIWLGLLTPFVALAPPAFFFAGMIWRDILFGAVWLVAAVLAFTAAGCSSRLRLALQALSLGLIAYGVLLRPNAVIAAPLLAAYAAWPSRFALPRAAMVYLPAAVVFAALVPLVYYGVLGAERQNPLHSIMVFDLGGITHFSADNQFPVQWSADETALLTSKCYDPAWWDTFWRLPPCPFVMQRLERRDDVIFGTSRLAFAWLHALATHPLAYLAHRATFMWQFLARSNLVLPVWDWSEPDSPYGHSPYFRPLLQLHDALRPTLMFRPGLWLIACIALGALTWPFRATPAGAFVVGVTSCAAVYVMSFFVLGVAADFRYAYWCVLATLAAVPAAILARYQGRADFPAIAQERCQPAR
jgi:hypothetical protein